jgi:hypothetical protein
MCKKTDKEDFRKKFVSRYNQELICNYRKLMSLGHRNPRYMRNIAIELATEIISEMETMSHAEKKSFELTLYPKSHFFILRFSVHFKDGDVDRVYKPTFITEHEVPDFAKIYKRKSIPFCHIGELF